MKGKVKWFNNRKGYGFITAETNDEIFVHYSKIKKDSADEYATLKQGQPVRFTIEMKKKGLEALNVERI